MCLAVVLAMKGKIMTTNESMFHLTVKDLWFYGRPMSQSNKAKIVRILRKSAATRVFDRFSTDSPKIDFITAHFDTREAAGAAAYDIETQVGMCQAVIEHWQ